MLAAGAGCGGSSDESAPPGIPAIASDYRAWAKLNTEPIPPRSSGDAHLGTKNVYASKKRAADGRFPDGTIVVKEATRPGKDFVGLLAVMRKQKATDPAHNDWVFVEYLRDEPAEAFSEAASGAVCWSCHMGAAKTDYLWIYTLGFTR
jgi:cytochrome P460